jgi:hypothetical protein
MQRVGPYGKPTTSWRSYSHGEKLCRLGFHLFPTKGLISYLFTERYDLVMTRDMFESPHIQLLVGLMQDKDLKKKMEGFGGYDLTNAGNVVYI